MGECRLELSLPHRLVGLSIAALLAIALSSTLLRRLGRLRAAALLPSLRNCPGGGAPKPPQLHYDVKNELGGVGIVAYGLLWMFVPPGSDSTRPEPGERRRAVGLAVMGIALAVGLSWLFSGGAASVITPVLVVAVGAALVWREFDAEGPRSVFGLPARPTVLTWARVLGGLTLVVTGLGVIVLAQVDVAALRSSLLAVVVTLIGAALLSVPLWIRMWRALESERAARARTVVDDDLLTE